MKSASKTLKLIAYAVMLIAVAVTVILLQMFLDFSLLIDMVIGVVVGLAVYSLIMVLTGNKIELN